MRVRGRRVRFFAVSAAGGVPIFTAIAFAAFATTGTAAATAAAPATRFAVTRSFLRGSAALGVAFFATGLDWPFAGACFATIFAFAATSGFFFAAVFGAGFAAFFCGALASLGLAAGLEAGLPFGFAAAFAGFTGFFCVLLPADFFEAVFADVSDFFFAAGLAVLPAAAFLDCTFAIHPLQPQN